MRRRALAIVLLFALSERGGAQLLVMNIGVFANGGVVGGLAPVTAGGRDRVLEYAGARGDLGVQGEHVGGGFGLRVWEFGKESDLGGGGVEFLMNLEFRRGRDARSALRVSYAVGTETFDGGAATTASLGTGSPELWSIGVGHEIPIPNTGTLLLSVDLASPAGGNAQFHRRTPIIELGIALRGRRLQSIRTLPGGRPR